MTRAERWAGLRSRRPLVLDGGLATELERRGHVLTDALWSARLLVDAPEVIREVHRDYLDAGADVISTASYQASRAGLARRGMDAAQSDRLIAASVTLAREACELAGRDALVAGSLGPYGALLADGSEYRGDDPLTPAELVEVHRPRVEALCEGGADFILFETLPSLREAEAVARIAGAMPEVSFWASFSAVADTGIAHGEPLGEAVEILAGLPNVLGIGVNCAAPQHALALLRSVRVEIGLGAAPNRGEAWDPEARRFVGEAQGFDLGAWAERYLAAGATLVGGCCRTTPSDIARVRAVV